MNGRKRTEREEKRNRNNEETSVQKMGREKLRATSLFRPLPRLPTTWSPNPNYTLTVHTPYLLSLAPWASSTSSLFNLLPDAMDPSLLGRPDKISHRIFFPQMCFNSLEDNRHTQGNNASAGLLFILFNYLDLFVKCAWFYWLHFGELNFRSSVKVHTLCFINSSIQLAFPYFLLNAIWETENDWLRRVFLTSHNIIL